MDARELREAAERLGRWIDRKAPEIITAPPEIRAMVSDVAIVSGHVLATMRPDDGEEATYEWAATVVDKDTLGDTHYEGKWVPEVWQVHPARYSRLFVGSTRRQFRCLCEALGVKTKEVQS